MHKECSSDLTDALVKAHQYVLQGRGSGEDDLWSGKAASVRLVFAQAFWQTGWFWGLALLVAVGLIGALLLIAHRSRVRRLLEVEETPRRTADDLHDDIGAKMSSIALMVDMAGRSGRLTEEERQRLAEAAQSARQVVDDLRDTVWLIDAGHDQLSDLILRMEKVARHMLQGTGHRIIRPDAAAVPPAALGMEMRRHVLMIFKEALHNTLRHSQASHVEALIDVRGGTLAFEVTDDGQGFNEAAVEAGHGLASMRRRARRIGGHLDVDSQPGQGTSVRLSVQIK